MRQNVRKERNMKEEVYLKIGTKFNQDMFPLLPPLDFCAYVGLTQIYVVKHALQGALERRSSSERETREAREISLCEIYGILFIIDEDISSLKNVRGSFW